MSEVSGIELEKKVPKGGDACFVKGLHKEIWGYDQSYIETARSYRTNSI